MKLGIKTGFHACWVGAHYSAYNKRLCVNFVPFFTVWLVLSGGKVP